MKIFEELSERAKLVIIILLVLLPLTAGFFIGRKTIKVPSPTIKIEYKELPPIHDTLFLPGKPYKVEIPADTVDIIKKCIADGAYKDLWPKQKEYITVEKEDTSAVIRDWGTKRYYKEKLFDKDTIGRCYVDAEVQYNRLTLTGYEFTPKVRIVNNTVYTIKKWSPFVEAGIMIGPWNKEPDTMGELGGGIFYKEKYGFELKYQRGFFSNTNYVGGAVLFKF